MQGAAGLPRLLQSASRQAARRGTLARRYGAAQGRIRKAHQDHPRRYSQALSLSPAGFDRTYNEAGGLHADAGRPGAGGRAEAPLRGLAFASMLTFLGNRLLQLVPTLFFVSLIIFLLQHLLPGDPALVMAGEEKDPQVIEQIRVQYHLDQPIPIQYVYWLNDVMHGNLGESLRIKQPVLDLVLEKLPVTVQLATMAMAIALLIGIGAGAVSAVKKDSAWDYGANAFAL